MAVAFGSTKTIGSGTGTGGTSTNWTVSGSGIAIVVHIGVSEVPSSITVTSTFTSGTIAQIKFFDISDHGAMYSYVIPNVTAGTGTYTVTFGNSVDYQISADYFTGADTTTPCPSSDAVSSETPSGSTITVTPSNLTANDAASGFGINVAAGDDPTFNQTQTYKENATNVNAAMGYHLGTGSISVTWGILPLGDSGMIAVRVVGASAGNSSSVTPSVSPSSSVSASVSRSPSPSSSSSSSASPSVAPAAYVERTVYTYVD